MSDRISDLQLVVLLKASVILPACGQSSHSEELSTSLGRTPMPSTLLPATQTPTEILTPTPHRLHKRVMEAKLSLIDAMTIVCQQIIRILRQRQVDMPIVD